MPKPMFMTVQVEEFAFGRVFRLLDTTPGVVTINLKGEGPRAKPNGKAIQKKGGAQSIPCLVLGALIKTPGLSRPQLIALLEGNGKKPSSLPDSLTKLRHAKEITSSGKGSNTKYQATKAGVKRFETACSIQPIKE